MSLLDRGLAAGRGRLLLLWGRLRGRLLLGWVDVDVDPAWELDDWPLLGLASHARGSAQHNEQGDHSDDQYGDYQSDEQPGRRARTLPPFNHVIVMMHGCFLPSERITVLIYRNAIGAGLVTRQSGCGPRRRTLIRSERTFPVLEAVDSTPAGGP